MADGVSIANKTRAEAVRYDEMLGDIVAEGYVPVYSLDDDGLLLCFTGGLELNVMMVVHFS